MYGHMVATNTLGHAYVIPVVETFENIRECLGATSVSLPDAEDLVDNIPAAGSPTFASMHDERNANTSSQVKPDVDGHTEDANVSRHVRKCLHDSKRWSSLFEPDRNIQDRRFVECLNNPSRSNLLDALLGYPSEDVSQCEIQAVKEFFQIRQDPDTSSRACAWLSFKPAAHRRYQKRCTASQFHSRLAQPSHAGAYHAQRKTM